MSPTYWLPPPSVLRPVQSNLKYFWLLQEDWKIIILLQESLFWTKIRACKWSKQRMAVRTVTSGVQNNDITAMFSCQEAQDCTTRPLTSSSSLGHPEWAKEYIQKKNNLSGIKRLKDTWTWVEQCGYYSFGDQQDLPTPIVGWSPLYGSKRCLTAVNDS